MAGAGCSRARHRRGAGPGCVGSDTAGAAATRTLLTGRCRSDAGLPCWPHDGKEVVLRMSSDQRVTVEVMSR